jgi:hypothetical protein
MSHWWPRRSTTAIARVDFLILTICAGCSYSPDSRNGNGQQDGMPESGHPDASVDGVRDVPTPGVDLETADTPGADGPVALLALDAVEGAQAPIDATVMEVQSTFCLGANSHLCNGSCVDIANAPNNCGECDVTCTTTQWCNQGKCTDLCMGASYCGSRCVDTSNDPTNCGKCNYACKASEYCSSGLCLATTGTAPSVCQGVFQYTLNTSDAYSATGQPPPKCQLQPDGSAIMTFVLPTHEWASCDFAAGANLNPFDADNQASGVMEIEFCAGSALVGPLNLWYGAFPTRKRLELLLSGETLLSGCRKVYKSPESAICHWSNTAWAGDCAGQPCAACNGLCNQGCPISFSTAKLTIIAEQPPQAITTTATVILKAVRFLPKTCTCMSDGGCSQSPDRPVCDTGLFQSSVCPQKAIACGVCISSDSCPHHDESCVIKLQDRSCDGTVKCQGEKSYCAFVDPSCAG